MNLPSAWRDWVAPILLLCCGGMLFAIDRSFESTEAQSRDMRDRIGRLIKKEDRDRIPLAAITVEIGETAKWTYAKLPDRWRVLDASNAVADADALDRLWKSFLDGEGIVHSADNNRLAEYGFSNQNVIRVVFHGPDVNKKKDKDVRWRCELGNRIADLGGCYVRLEGSSKVWAMDSDPRSIIEDSRRGALPPLVEGTLVSRSTLQSGGQFDTVTIEAPGRPPLRLKLEQVAIDPSDMEAMRGGKDPFKWVATSGGEVAEVDPRTAMAFYQVMMSAKGARLLDPKIASARGIDVEKNVGESKLSFGSDSGVGFELIVSPPATNGARAIYNTESKVLFEVDAELAQLLVPELAELAAASPENPWQQYLAKVNAAEQAPPSIEMPPNAK